MGEHGEDAKRSWGRSWKLMEAHGSSWKLMEAHGDHVRSLEIHVRSLEIYVRYQEIMGDCKVEPGWYKRVAECVEGSMEITVVAGFVHRRRNCKELCCCSKMHVNPDHFF